MSKDETLSEAVQRMLVMLWTANVISVDQQAEFEAVVEKVSELENEAVFVRRQFALFTRSEFEGHPVGHMLELIADDLDGRGTHESIMRARAGWVRRFASWGHDGAG